MSKYRQNSRMLGFTLVELMITIFVAAILVALALPSFRETIIRTKVTTSTNSLMVAISLARSEAAKRGVPVAVIANAGTSSWGSTGWYVQASSLDSSTPPNTVFTGGATFKIRTFGPFDANYNVTSAATTTTCSGACTSDGQIVFDATGALIGATQVDLNVCRPDKKASEQNRIVIAQSGIAASYRDTSTSSAPSC